MANNPTEPAIGWIHIEGAATDSNVKELDLSMESIQRQRKARIETLLADLCMKSLQGVDADGEEPIAAPVLSACETALYRIDKLGYGASLVMKAMPDGDGGAAIFVTSGVTARVISIGIDPSGGATKGSRHDAETRMAFDAGNGGLAEAIAWVKHSE